MWHRSFAFLCYVVLQASRWGCHRSFAHSFVLFAFPTLPYQDWILSLRSLLHSQIQMELIGRVKCLFWFNLHSYVCDQCVTSPEASLSPSDASAKEKKLYFPCHICGFFFHLLLCSFLIYSCRYYQPFLYDTLCVYVAPRIVSAWGALLTAVPCRCRCFCCYCFVDFVIVFAVTEAHTHPPAWTTQVRHTMFTVNFYFLYFLITSPTPSRDTCRSSPCSSLRTRAQQGRSFHVCFCFRKFICAKPAWLCWLTVLT